MRRVAIAILAITALLYAAPALADRVIPPGRERDVMALLGGGATFPDGCRFDGASIEGSRAVGRYACPDGPRQVTLMPPRHDTILATESFSLRIEPSGHDAFEAAIVANVRAHEGGWTWLASSQTARRQPPTHASHATRGHLAGWLSAWLLATLVLAVLAARTHVEPSRPGMPDPAERRRVAVLGVLALGLFVLLRARVATPPAHPDTGRDLLLAIDCHIRGCVTGPSATAPGIQQGTLWPRALGALIRAGLGPHGVQTAWLASYALAAFALAWVWLRIVSARGAIVILCAAIPLASIASEAPVLWAPSLAPGALFVATGAFLLAVDAVAPWWGMLAGLAFAAAAEAHVVCAPLVFVAPAVLFGVARNPFAAPLTLGSSLALMWMASPGTWSNDLRVFPPWLLGGGLLVTIAAAVIARKRLAARDRSVRLRIALVALASPAIAVSVGALALAPPGSLERFVLPAVPAILFALGAIAGAFPATPIFTGARVLLAVAVLAPLARHAASSPWTMRDASRIAAALAAEGIGWAETRDHLAIGDEVREAMAPWDLRIGRTSRRDAGERALLRVRRGIATPAGVRAVPLDDGSVGWIVRCLDVIDTTSWQVCGRSACEVLDSPEFNETVAADRAYPAWPSLSDRTADDTREFHVALRPLASGEVTIVSADERWRLTLEGANSSSALGLHAPWPASTEIRAIVPFGTRPRWPAPLCAVPADIISAERWNSVRAPDNR